MANKYDPKDPLCKKVYDWEDGQFLASMECMRLIDARRWVRKACKYYGVTPPKVVMLPASAKISGYHSDSRLIDLIPLHKNPIVVLHEAAHHIHDELLGRPNGPLHHPPAWFSIFMWLILKFGVYEQSFLRASLRPYRLTLKPLGPEVLLRP